MRSLFATFGFAILAAISLAQTSPSSRSAPYATLDRNAVTYRGPVSTGSESISNDSAVIGLILPLHGPQQREGEALLAAAQLAIQQEQSRGPLPDGRQLRLVVRDESGPWGQASMEILKLFDQDHALAIVTSANGASAHLAEQIAIKISIPILTLASDPTTTETNVPWIFRMGPSDTNQARSFCQKIYASTPSTERVLLFAQADHDGRTGAEAFEKIAKEFTSAPVTRFDISEARQAEALRSQLLHDPPEAIVLWTDAPEANAILTLLRSTVPNVPVFLSTKSAQLLDPAGTARSPWFTIDSPATATSAALPNILHSYAARQIYDAVHTISTALRTTGANRVLLRDYLANQLPNAQTAHATPFDSAGNSLQSFSLVPLAPQ